MPARCICPGLYVIPVGPVNTFLLDSPDGCVTDRYGFSEEREHDTEGYPATGKTTGRYSAHCAHPCASRPYRRGRQAAAGNRRRALCSSRRRSDFGARRRRIRPLYPAPGLKNGILFRLFIGRLHSVEPVWADQLVNDVQVLPITGGIKAVHAPGGHCAGQLALLWPQNGGVLFAADACSNLFGLNLAPHLSAYEDLEEGKRSLNKLAKTGVPNRAHVFGHGKAILHDAREQFRTARQAAGGPFSRIADSR